MKTKHFFILIGMSVMFILGVVVNKQLHSQSEPDPAETGMFIELPEPKRIDKFHLKQHTGSDFKLENLSEKWTLMFFGYTNCPDVCPQTLARMQQVYQLIRAEGIAADDLQVVFVSVDPVRDHLDHLAKYIAYFNSDFIGVTGDKREIDQLVQAVGAAYFIESPENGSPDIYMVNHSSAIFVINPMSRLSGLFTTPHAPDFISRRFISIYKERG